MTQEREIPVDNEKLREALRESRRSSFLKDEVFNSFPSTVSEYLATDRENLVKLLPMQGMGLHPGLEAIPVPVRFYIRKVSIGLTYKCIEIPSLSVSMLALDTYKTKYLMEGIGSHQMEKVLELNKVTKADYKRKKKEFREKIREFLEKNRI